MRVKKVRLINNDEIVLNDLENGYTVLVTFIQDTTMSGETIGYHDIKLSIIDTFRGEIVKVMKTGSLTKEQMDKSYSILPRDESCWEKLTTIGRLKNYIEGTYEEFLQIEVDSSETDDSKSNHICKRSLVNIDSKEIYV